MRFNMCYLGWAYNAYIMRDLFETGCFIIYYVQAYIEHILRWDLHLIAQFEEQIN